MSPKIFSIPQYSGIEISRLTTEDEEDEDEEEE